MAFAAQSNLGQLLITTRTVRRYLLPYLREDFGYFLLMCALLVGITIANTTMIWLLGTSVDLLTNSQFKLLSTNLVWLAGIVVLNQFMLFTHLYLIQWVGLRFIARIRKAALLHIMRLSFPVTTRFSKGDIMARLTNDIDRLLTFILDVPLSLISHALIISFYLSMLFWIDVKLALVALCLSPLYYMTQHVLSPRKGRAANKYYRHNGELMAFEEQVLGNLRGISSFTVEERISEKHHKVFDIARFWVLKMRVIDIVYDRVFAVLIYLTGVLIVYLGIEDIATGQLLVGTLVSFIVYLGYLSVPVRGLAQIPIQLQGDVSAAQRVIELLDAQPSVVSAMTTITDKEIKTGSIAINNIYFAYTELGTKVFNGFSEKIKAGECVALVGASGSGKSTLANLIMRFYDPQQGDIEIDGTNIKSLALEELRNSIAIVWQEPFFINDTIRENLRLARPDATEHEMILACNNSFAWEFISKLDKGLDTVIGSHGSSLSAGQFQRLAIAQAFLRDAPILILDEASSALDSQSEQKIVESLENLRKGRTTLIIAHRYSSIRAADRILYFNGDGTVSSGTRDEMLQNNPQYQQAVEWQTSFQPAK